MKKGLKILMIWPKTPLSTSNFEYSARFAGRKTYLSPYGLCTLAGYLPDYWHVRLVNMDIEKLSDSAIKWSNYVFISGTCTQELAILEISRRVHHLGRYCLLGGAYVTSDFNKIKDEPSIKTFCINECEPYVDQLVHDLEMGTPRNLYGPGEERPDITKQKPPRLDLIKDHLNDYLNMPLQISRGCPNRCEFCSITANQGRYPRYKLPEQVTTELNAYYSMGWRGYIWIIDDNFIGNKRKAKIILKAIIEWQKKFNYPFTFGMQISINIAEDEELVALFLEANIKDLYIGIESVNEESLRETRKLHNINKKSIKERIQILIKAGFHVMGALMLGFDSDPENIFDQEVQFVNDALIPWCDVYILRALSKTDLFNRLKLENRLLPEQRPEGVHYIAEHYGVTNFRTKLRPDILQRGYAKVLKEINNAKSVYDRLKGMLMLQEKQSIDHLFLFTDRMNLGNLFLILKVLMLFPNRAHLVRTALWLKRKGNWRFYRFFYNLSIYYHSIYITPKILKNIENNPVDVHGMLKN